MNQEQLAEVVGEMAAFMIFGQGAQCIGKEFSLRRLNGSGRVTIRVTTSGAVIV